MTNKECAVIVFSKAPVPGTVKTRLIPSLGEEGAAELYRDLLRQTLMTVAESDIEDVRLYCTPTIKGDFLQNQSQDFTFTLHLQAGCDLGERMYKALKETLAIYDSALVIGCDCPELSADDLNTAHRELIDGYDVVIGPAEDGGYYLIGMSCLDKAVFQGIEWGGSDVFARTCERIGTLGLTTYELQQRWDLDRPEDLSRYKSQ